MSRGPRVPLSLSAVGHPTSPAPGRRCATRRDLASSKTIVRAAARLAWPHRSGAAVGDIRGAAHGCRTDVVLQAGPLLEGAGDDVYETAERPHLAIGRRRKRLFDAVIARDIDGVDLVHRGGHRGTVRGQQDLAAGGPGDERVRVSGTGSAWALAAPTAARSAGSRTSRRAAQASKGSGSVNSVRAVPADSARKKRVKSTFCNRISFRTSSTRARSGAAIPSFAAMPSAQCRSYAAGNPFSTSVAASTAASLLSSNRGSRASASRARFHCRILG